jgi:hypothetical protein
MNSELQVVRKQQTVAPSKSPTQIFMDGMEKNTKHFSQYRGSLNQDCK